MGVTWVAAIFLACWSTPAARSGMVFHLPESLEAETVRQLASQVEEHVNRSRKQGKEDRFLLVLDFNPGGRPMRLTNLDACLALTRLLQGLIGRKSSPSAGWRVT